MQTQQLSPPYPGQHHGAQVEHYFHQVQVGGAQTSPEPTYQPAENIYSVSDDINNESTVGEKNTKKEDWDGKNYIAKNFIIYSLNSAGMGCNFDGETFRGEAI
jgi:hypothetical protein